MVAIKGQLVFHVKGNQEQTAEGKHQARDLDQVQEGVPSKVAKHKTQNHTMKIDHYFIERHSPWEFQAFFLLYFYLPLKYPVMNLKVVLDHRRRIRGIKQCNFNAEPGKTLRCEHRLVNQPEDEYMRWGDVTSTVWEDIEKDKLDSSSYL